MKFVIKFVYVVALLFAIGGMLALISSISGGGGDNVMQQTGAIARLDELAAQDDRRDEREDDEGR